MSGTLHSSRATTCPASLRITDGLLGVEPQPVLSSFFGGLLGLQRMGPATIRPRATNAKRMEFTLLFPVRAGEETISCVRPACGHRIRAAPEASRASTGLVTAVLTSKPPSSTTIHLRLGTFRRAPPTRAHHRSHPDQQHRSEEFFHGRSLCGLCTRRPLHTPRLNHPPAPLPAPPPPRADARPRPTDQPAGLEDSPAGLADAPAPLPDTPTGLPDSPARLQDLPATLQDSPASLRGSPTRLQDPLAPLPDPRPRLPDPPSRLPDPRPRPPDTPSRPADAPTPLRTVRSATLFLPLAPTRG